MSDPRLLCLAVRVLVSVLDERAKGSEPETIELNNDDYAGICLQEIGTDRTRTRELWSVPVDTSGWVSPGEFTIKTGISE